MTTIVYRDGVLAADSKVVSSGYYLEGSVKKIWKTVDGRLLGITGELANCMVLVNWLRKPPKDRKSSRPDLPKDFGTVVEIMKNGSVLVHQASGFYQRQTEYFTYGSGSPVAMGALYMGATAVEAVKAAIRYDNDSGGRVHTVKL